MLTLFISYCSVSSQPCCASFNDGYWYRAEVEKLVCPDVVRIRYVDYGNMAEIPVTSIRRPKPNYLLLPAQAVESRLCHLKPAGSVSMGSGIGERLHISAIFKLDKDLLMSGE